MPQRRRAAGCRRRPSSLVDAKEIGRGKAQLVAGRGQPEKRAVLRAGPQHAGHQLVAFGHGILDLAVIVAESREHRCNKLLLSGKTLRQVRIALDEIDHHVAIGDARLALVEDVLDVVPLKLFVRRRMRRRRGNGREADKRGKHREAHGDLPLVTGRYCAITSVTNEDTAASRDVSATDGAPCRSPAHCEGPAAPGARAASCGRQDSSSGGAESAHWRKPR
jgi:hypothetical protein